MLSLYLSLVVFQLGGLHYRLCYNFMFIITLNEGLGLQLFDKTLRFLTGFAYKLLKIGFKRPLAREPWSSVRGPGAP